MISGESYFFDSCPAVLVAFAVLPSAFEQLLASPFLQQAFLSLSHDLLFSPALTLATESAKPATRRRLANFFMFLFFKVTEQM